MHLLDAVLCMVRLIGNRDPQTLILVKIDRRYGSALRFLDSSYLCRSSATSISIGRCWNKPHTKTTSRHAVVSLRADVQVLIVVHMTDVMVKNHAICQLSIVFSNINQGITSLSTSSNQP